MNKRIPMLVATLGAAALMGAGLVGVAFAQAPTQPTATPTAKAERSGQRAEGLPTRGDKPVRGGVSKTGTEVLSKLTGLTADEIKEQLQAGLSLAQIAESKGVAKDKLIAAIVAVKTAKISAQVEAGTLTQEMAGEALAKLTEQVTSDVDRVGKPAPGKPATDTGARQAPISRSKTAMEVLIRLTGLTSDDIKAQQQAGQSLAQIAEAKGIARDKLVAEIVAAKTAKINDQVKAGTMTQEKADEALAALTEQVTADVDRAGSASPAGRTEVGRPARGGKGGGVATPPAAQ